MISQLLKIIVVGHRTAKADAHPIRMGTHKFVLKQTSRGANLLNIKPKLVPIGHGFMVSVEPLNTWFELQSLGGFIYSHSFNKKLHTLKILFPFALYGLLHLTFVPFPSSLTHSFTSFSSDFIVHICTIIILSHINLTFV